MPTVKTLAKGQIVIPASIRKKYNIKPNTKLQIMEFGNIIYLIPPVDDPISSAYGILQTSDSSSLSQKLLNERKRDFD